MIKVSVIGATGYTGGELLRYLLKHPGVKVTHCTSESYSGKEVSEIHPDLAGKFGCVLEKLDVKKISQDCDLVFLCLPHGESAAGAYQFLNQKVKVIDLSADFRLTSPKVYKEWYGLDHPHPELLKEAVYGLPEIYRKAISSAKLVANPGCYATAAILTLLPLCKKKWIDPGSVVIDAKSGVTGAGRKLENRYLFCEENENFMAYGVAQHRHVPEIEQVLSAQNGSAFSMTFVPHLLPVNRGILATVYATLEKKVTSSQLRQLYAEFYRNESFVVVLSEDAFPEIRSVQHSNFCQIGVRVDARNQRAILIGAIDNLGKGASSQAIQNMNLMFGLNEAEGLM